MKRKIIVFVALAFIPHAAWAVTEPKILFEEDPASLVSTISISILSGVVEDPVEKTGLTNLYSELMLRGSKKYDRAKFQSAMERMGATLGVAAGNDRIAFTGVVIKENTFEFLKLLEEALLHPTFPKNEFDALKTEVLNEIAHSKNSNGRLGSLAMRREVFKGTPLERMGNGSLKTIQAITLTDIQRAYNNSFHQANIVFAVASPIKEAQWIKPLKDIWLQLPDGAQRTRRVFPPKIPTTPELVVVHKTKTSTGVLQFTQTGITAQDPARYALGMGNFSFGGEPLVSRLFRTIRGQLGWTYAIGSSYGSLGPLTYQPGLYTISATPSVEFTGKTIFRLMADWKTYLDKGLSSDELELAQESLINSYPFEFETAEKRLGLRLNSLLYNVPILSQSEFEDKISSIKNKDLLKMLKDHQSPEGWLITLVADKDIVEKQLAEEQKEIPAEKRLKIKKVYLPEEVIE